MKAFLMALAFLLTGCQSMPKLPDVVKIPVKVFKPIPDWAVEQLPNPAPANATVEEVVRANNRRAEIIDFANCRSRLLAKLDKGEPASIKDCRRP